MKKTKNDLAPPQAHISLPQIDDPNKYRKVSHVAILDEDNEGEGDLTPDFLRTVVKQTNERIEGGDLILLTLGHTDDEKDEIEQPPIVGYARNLVLGKLGNKDCVLADFYIQNDKYDEAMSFPRRSVEMWHDKDQGFIDIVSLLRRTPARNLGLLTLSKNGMRKDRYIKQFTGAKMNPEDIEKLAAALATHLCKGDDVEKEDLDKDDDADDDVEKDDYEASEPSSDNTYVPGEVDEKKARKMRRESAFIKLSRVEKELAETAQERDLALLMLRRSEIERDLKQREAEGFLFDGPSELAYCEKMNKEEYTNHLERMQALYRRVPVGRTPIRTAEPVVGTSKEEVDKVVKFAAANKLDFATALNRYKQQEVK